MAVHLEAYRIAGGFVPVRVAGNAAIVAAYRLIAVKSGDLVVFDIAVFNVGIRVQFCHFFVARQSGVCNRFAFHFDPGDHVVGKARCGWVQAAADVGIGGQFVSSWGFARLHQYVAAAAGY